MADSAGSPLSDAIGRLWVKYLPQIEARVATLRNAAASLERGTLSETEQHQASADAHKLAGVLGTFGLKDGTDLAREAEAIYAGTVDGDPDISARLIAIAEQLSEMIAKRE